LSIVLTWTGVGFVVLRVEVDVSSVDVRPIGGDRAISLPTGAVDDDGRVLAPVGAIRNRRVRRGIAIALASRSARTGGAALPSQATHSDRTGLCRAARRGEQDANTRPQPVRSSKHGGSGSSPRADPSIPAWPRYTNAWHEGMSPRGDRRSHRIELTWTHLSLHWKRSGLLFA
jgi:hypothetical protein